MEIDRLVDGLAARLPPGSCCWGVPRGGSVVAALLRSKHGVPITADLSEATIAVDDLIDSGRTARMVQEKYNLNLEPLLVKQNTDWIVFPWEGTELAEDAENTVTRMLQQIGEDPNRPELEDTPRQVVEFWDKLYSGYRYTGEEVAGLLQCGPAGPEGAADSGMVVLPSIPFVSSCENHLLPFFGMAHVGYLPCKEQGSLGDVSMLVGALSRRLQLQDRLTGQICDILNEKTAGAAVLLQGNYLCLMVEGRSSRQTTVETTAFGGRFEASAELQSRFLRLSRQALDN